MRYANYPPASVAPNGAPSPQTTRSDHYLTTTTTHGLTPPSNYPTRGMPQYDSYGRRKSSKRCSHNSIIDS
jgi:hypothetical protein